MWPPRMFILQIKRLGRWDTGDTLSDSGDGEVNVITVRLTVSNTKWMSCTQGSTNYIYNLHQHFCIPTRIILSDTPYEHGNSHCESQTPTNTHKNTVATSTRRDSATKLHLDRKWHIIYLSMLPTSYFMTINFQSLIRIINALHYKAINFIS